MFQHSLSLSRNSDGIFPRCRFGNIRTVQIYEFGPRESRRFEDYNEVTGEDISERKTGFPLFIKELHD